MKNFTVLSPHEHRQAVEKLQRESLLTACVLIAPDKSEVRLYRSDFCDFAGLIYLLQDGWKFFALLGMIRDPEKQAYGWMPATLEGAEGVPSVVLDRAMQAFKDSVLADGIAAPKASGSA